MCIKDNAKTDIRKRLEKMDKRLRRIYHKRSLAGTVMFVNKEINQLITSFVQGLNI